eukprot:TRINITY_DN1929_c0_g1_i2.p2 TRINITY_DN1929_c0_g1~~TRINITY_DN1929_c0_g1_i2.p2  ORF type:complete len:159 (-),score=57.36 TRINITY_DN1929_c0_g1_i2:1247-1723(-)
MMIPISLKVSIDVVKYAYASFIEWDAALHDDETDFYAQATNTNISENLAQVEYIFSDKTGTLTQNSMKVKYLTIGNHLLNLSLPNQRKELVDGWWKGEMEEENEENKDKEIVMDYNKRKEEDVVEIISDKEEGGLMRFMSGRSLKEKMMLFLLAFNLE